jgi:hypothetical protein
MKKNTGSSKNIPENLDRNTILKILKEFDK